MSEPYTIDNPPPDWVYESDDRSVGIFAEGWYHALEDCAGEAFDPEETLLQSVYHDDGANRRLVQTVRYRCPCGAEMTVLDTIYDPDIPEDLPDAWDDPGPTVPDDAMTVTGREPF